MVYSSEFKSSSLTSQVQLGGYESPDLFRHSQLRKHRSPAGQCIDHFSRGTEAFQFSPTQFSIELELTSPVSATSRCGTHAVLRTSYNSLFEFHNTTKHYNNGLKPLLNSPSSFHPQAHSNLQFSCGKKRYKSAIIMSNI